MREFAKKQYDEVLTIQTSIYPLESVQLAASALIDDGFFYIYGEEQGKSISALSVAIKPRKVSDAETALLKADFFRELNRQSLRIQMAKINRKVRTQVIGRALSSSIPSDDDKKA